jgi:hypothetical protein
MKPEWTPVNPCTGCAFHCLENERTCLEFEIFQSNLAAIEKVLDAIENEQTIIKDGIGVPIRVIESMLVKIREAKG